MAYSVDTYRGSRTFTVEDGTINNSLDIALIGKNYAGYGESLNENFVHLLENFAGTVPPPRPINGQIWFDATVKKIKVWDASIGSWKISGSTEVSANPPQGLSIGGLWWDEINKQLYVFDGSKYVLVGPQSIASFGTTEIKSVTVTDNSAPPQSKTILVAYVADEIMYVISKEEFTLSADSALTLGTIGTSSSGTAAFSLIKAGITLVNTPSSNGITTTARRFHGTASSAIGLVDDLGNLLTANDFLRSTLNLTDFTNSVPKFGDDGYLLGNGEDLEVKIQNESDVLFRNKVGRLIRFQTRSSSQDNTPLVLEEMHVLPGIDNVTDLGSTTFRFRQVRASNFFGTFEGSFIGNGSGLTGIPSTSIVGDIPTGNITGTLDVTALRANSLLVGTEYRVASISVPDIGDPNTIAVRDQNGDLNATTFRGTATAALYADLAEKYLADQDYEVGTVVSVGGSAEVTACQRGDRAFGAVSANPAFKMNDGLVNGTYIALKGRVPIKVLGPVHKGDKLIACDNGCAGVAAEIMKNMQIRISNLPDTFAIALEDNESPDIKLVECVIL